MAAALLSMFQLLFFLEDVAFSADGFPDSASSPAALPFQTRILEMFRRWDVNGDGVITKDELQQVLVSVGMTENDAASTFAAVDADRNGKVDYKEFVNWLYSKSAPEA